MLMAKNHYFATHINRVIKPSVHDKKNHCFSHCQSGFSTRETCSRFSYRRLTGNGKHAVILERSRYCKDGRLLIIQQRPGQEQYDRPETEVCIYPNYKVVVSKGCPGVIKLDPVLVSKYLRADGAAQLIQIQAEVPAVLVLFCADWRGDDGLSTFGNAVGGRFIKLGLLLEFTAH